MNSIQFARTTVFLLMLCATGTAMAEAKSDYIEIVSKAVVVLDRADGPVTTFIVPDNAEAELVIALKTVGKISERAALPKSEKYTLPKGYFIVEEIRYKGNTGVVTGIAGPGALKGTLGAEVDCGKRYSISFSRTDGKWENGPYKTKYCVPPAMLRESFVKLQNAAASGDAEAQFRLGLLYRNGDNGVTKDDAEAATWYRKAAEQGYAKAQLTLGYMLAEGLGVAKNDAEAVSWYRKAAGRGDVHAQYYLGLMIYSGRGMPKDETEAVSWFRRAADQGDVDAQTMYGMALESGHGVPKDETEAANWYRRAAAQGDATARERLDGMTAPGRDGGKN